MSPTVFGDYQKTGDHKDIGFGAFGQVFTWYKIGNTSIAYAGKIVAKVDWNGSEVKNLKNCNHVNIVRYVDFVIQAQEVLLVTELLNSTLFDGLRSAEESMFAQKRCGRGVRIIRTKFAPPLNLQEVTQIITNCFDGLNYLHEQHIMHRDISSANIFLEVADRNGRRDIVAKYGDFGLSKLLVEDKKPTTHLCNAFYSDPEASRNREYDGFAADIYSLGVVIVEAMIIVNEQWHLLASDYDNGRPFAAVRAKCLDALQLRLPPPIIKLINDMVDENPSKRIPIGELSRRMNRDDLWTIMEGGSSQDTIYTNNANADAMSKSSNDNSSDSNSSNNDDVMEMCNVEEDDFTARESFQELFKSFSKMSNITFEMVAGLYKSGTRIIKS
eukprot:gene25589-30902_t